MCQFPVTMSRLEEVYHNMNWMTSTHVFASSQLASSYYTAPNISWPYCSLKFLVLWQINDIQLLKTTFKPLHVGRCASHFPLLHFILEAPSKTRLDKHWKFTTELCSKALPMVFP